MRQYILISILIFILAEMCRNTQHGDIPRCLDSMLTNYCLAGGSETLNKTIISESDTMSHFAPLFGAKRDNVVG